MNTSGALDVIGLLAKAWAEKTDGDISNAFRKIAQVADKALQELDVCPLCFGDKYVLHNDGLMRQCPACQGTGKRTYASR